MTHLNPSPSAFSELARDHVVVPVWREVLADLQTPVAAFLRLREVWRDSFLLESVEGGERWARYSFVGGDAYATVKAKDGRVWVEGDATAHPEAGEAPLAFVRRLLEGYSAPRLEELPPFHGGAVGFIGYDCVRELERLPGEPPDDLNLPDLALILSRTLVVFDHFAQKAFVIVNVPVGDNSDEAYAQGQRRCDEVVELLSEPLSASTLEVKPVEGRNFECTVDDAEYGRWVEVVREHIYAGDIFQAVPSRRFSAPIEGSSFDAYRMLRTVNPSPYMYFLRFSATDEHPEFEIAGSSPEPLVRVSGGHIITRPIAGTRPRGRTEDEDEGFAADLLADEKERAEHVMLVDLARNDVGRVARYGSVNVDQLMIIERYSHVMHIVSNVSGELADDRNAFDALLACFPAGTVTGAPKVRAMEIIDSLEKTRRGPYAGVVGYFDFAGDLDTCITIRTIVATGGHAYVQAGAGVVADSVPQAEADETRRKAEALLRAVEAST